MVISVRELHGGQLRILKNDSDNEESKKKLDSCSNSTWVFLGGSKDPKANIFG